MDRSGRQVNEIPRTVVLFLLRVYKRAVSPLFLPACRYVPSCSEYAMEAVDRHGVARGSMMAIWRVFRCHPFAKGGIDPVVQPQTLKPKLVEPESSGMAVHGDRETELCRH